MKEMSLLSYIPWSVRCTAECWSVRLDSGASKYLRCVLFENFENCNIHIQSNAAKLISMTYRIMSSNNFTYYFSYLISSIDSSLYFPILFFVLSLGIKKWAPYLDNIMQVFQNKNYFTCSCSYWNQPQYYKSPCRW